MSSIFFPWKPEAFCMTLKLDVNSQASCAQAVLLGILQVKKSKEKHTPNLYRSCLCKGPSQLNQDQRRSTLLQWLQLLSRASLPGEELHVIFLWERDTLVASISTCFGIVTSHGGTIVSETLMCSTVSWSSNGWCPLGLVGWKGGRPPVGRIRVCPHPPFCQVLQGQH